MKIFPKAYVSLALALAVTGCAAKDEVKPDAAPAAVSMPEPTVQPTDRATAPPTPAKALSYVVRKGDSLWLIASRKDVLGDPMQWPLLYKSNRDQLADPDLIQVGEELNYVEDADEQDVAAAEQEAKDTPSYAPHTDVRKAEAVNY